MLAAQRELRPRSRRHAMTRAPRILPISTAVSPTPPAAPSTSSVSPRLSCARSCSAWCEVAYTIGKHAAVVKSICGGSAHHARRLGHDLLGKAAVAARSPAPACRGRAATPAPTCLDDACDFGSRGEWQRRACVWYLPCTIRPSRKLTPQAWVAISTCPGPACGAGTSSRVSCSRAANSLRQHRLHGHSRCRSDS